MANITKDTNKLMDLYLSNLAIALEKMDTIKDVLNTFNNKVFNARVVNKLEETINAGLISTKHFYFTFDFTVSAMKLTMRFYNYRSFAGENYFQYLPSGLESIDLIPYTPSEFNNCYSTKRNEDFCKRQEDAYFYLDNDHLRMNTDFICKRLEEGRAYLKDTIERLKTDRARIEEYEAKRKELAEALKELQNKMSYECKDIYSLKDYNMYI